MSEYIQNYEQSNSNDQSAKFDALKDIPFSGNKIEQTNENELRHRSNGEKAQRLMELSKITELRQNEEAFDNRIQELNRDGAYKYLMTLNGILRGVDRSERGVRSNIQVGEHMAPSRKVQGAILNDVTESLKGIKDNTILIINTDEQRENISLRLSLTERQKERMVCIPATRISRKNLGKVFPNIPMLTGIIYNLNIYKKEEYLNEIEKKLRESFSDREELVKGNLNVAKETWEYLEQNYN